MRAFASYEFERLHLRKCDFEAYRCLMKSEHKDKKNLQFLECKNQRRQWQNLFIFEPFFIFCISYEETHCQDNAQCIRGDFAVK